MINKTRLYNILYNNLLSRVELRLNPHRKHPYSNYLDDQLAFIGKTHFSNCIDIGSGVRPFPFAQTLVDKYDHKTMHNQGPPKVLSHQTLILADIENLPFDSQIFDYSYCSHVLEHTNDPAKACNELMRISKGGYIETPRIGSDALFSTNTDAHKWVIHDHNNTLYFFPNVLHTKYGMGSAFRDVLSMFWFHPLQREYYNHHRTWNVMFNWEHRFHVVVANPHYCELPLASEVLRQEI